MYATSPFGLLLLLPVALWLEGGRASAYVAALFDGNGDGGGGGEGGEGDGAAAAAARGPLGALVGSIGLASMGAALAFLMLLFELRVVQLASSLTLSVAGVLKELLTVAASVALLGESLTSSRAAGLLLCLGGILAYQRLKAREVRTAAAAAPSGRSGLHGLHGLRLGGLHAKEPRSPLSQCGSPSP